MFGKDAISSTWSIPCEHVDGDDVVIQKCIIIILLYYIKD